MAKKKEVFSGKSESELKGLVAEYKRELFNLRFQQATGELENTARFRELKRNVARANTALSALKSHAA